MKNLLLLLVYVLLVLPAALWCRLTRDPLRRRWDQRAASYWDLSAPGT